MMSNIISFIGLRRGIGNSALLRAFAVEAAESLYCIVVDFDESSSSTYDWAIRRDQRGFRPSVPVERGATFDFTAERPDIELVMVDASNCSRQLAMELAGISRLVVVSSTTDPGDLARVIDQMKAWSDAGLGERVLAALCRVQSTDEASAARETLGANGVKLLPGEISEGTISYPPLEREGRALCESPRPLLAQSAAVVIDGIQKAFVDGIEMASP